MNDSVRKKMDSRGKRNMSGIEAAELRGSALNEKGKR